MPKISAEHAEARRNQILDAATTCFARNGIQQTTIKSICAEAGLSAGAVYGYFASKQAILQAVYERDVLQNRSFGQQLRVADDPIDTIRQMIGAMVRYVGDPRLHESHQLAVRVHAESLVDPELSASYTAIHRDVLAEITPLLRSLQESGRLPAQLDAEYFLWVIIAVYQGLRIQHLLDPTLDLDRFREVLLQMADASLQISAEK
jgi:AcrR family transcriptional regulator